MISYETIANGTAFNDLDPLNKQQPIQQQQKPKQEESFLRNSILNVGANSIVNPILGVGSTIADNLGNQDLKETLMNESKDYSAIANATTRDYQDITKLKNASDVGKFAGYQALNLGVNLLPMIGVGGIAKGIASGVTESNFIRGAVDKLASGTVAGLQNMGSLNAMNIAEKNDTLNNEQNLGAFGSGAVLGVAEQNAVLGKLGVTGSRLANAGISGLFNAGVGVGQSAINRDILGKDLTDEQAINEYINAGAVGGIVGGVGGLVTKPKGVNIDENIITNERKTNEPNAIVDNVINNSSDISNIKPNIEDNNVNQVVTRKLIDNVDDFKSVLNDKNNPNDGIIDTSPEALLPPLNFDEYKNSKSEILKDLNEPIVKRINEITDNFKIQNEDGTFSISKNDSLLIDKITDLVKNSDENNTQKTKFLNEINKITKEDNFDNSSTTKLLEKFKQEENNNIKPLEDNIKPIDENKVLEQNTIKPLEENIVKTIDKNIKQEDNIKPLEEKLNTIKDNLKNASTKDIYDYIETSKQLKPLDLKEKSEIMRIEESIKPIRDVSNVDIVVIPEKYSPFGSDANGWFDKENNRIIIVGTDKTKEKTSNILMHEIWHKGISNSVNNKGREFVTEKFNELYNNNVIKEIADGYMNTGMERNKAIEEAIGRAIEDNRLIDTKFIDKIFTTIKNLINKIAGKDLKLTNEDVRDFINKTNETVFDENKIAENTEINKSVLMFSLNSKDDKLVNARTDFEQKEKETLTKLGNILLPENLNNSKEFNKYYKESMNTLNPYNKIMEYVATTRHLMEKIGGSEIFNVKTRQNSFAGNLENKYQQLSIKMDRIYKENKINEKDLILLNKFVSENAYRENDGKGVRISENDVKNFLAGKVNNKKFNALIEYYNTLRESADTNIYLNGLKDTISTIDPVMSSLRKSNKDVAELLKETLSQVSKNNLIDSDPNVITIRNLQDKLLEIFTTNKDKFSVETQELLKPILTNLSNIKELNKALYERGYIPKDMKGQFVVSVIHKATGKAVGVYAFKNAQDSSKFYAKMNIDLKNDSDFAIQSYERQQALSSDYDLKKAINEIAKNGVTITDDLLKSISKLDVINSDFERQYKGFGYNEKLANVVHDSSYDNIKNSSRSFGNSEILDVINKYPDNSVEKIHLIELKNQMDKNEEVSDKPLDKGLRQVRSVTSTFALGLNLANSVAQLFQSSLIGISHATKYGTSGNLKFTEAVSLLKNDYKTSDPLLKEVLDNLKNNELLGANMTKQMFEDTKKQHNLNAFDKFKQVLYKPNELTEKTLRLATVLRSVEVYKMALDGKLPSKELNDSIKSQNITDFVSNELAIINGDFTAPNRSKVLQGDFAQTILMFQQWKAMTLHAFDNMDAKGKALYIISNGLAGGVLGLPFAQDAVDTFDFFAKMFGYNIPAKRAINNGIKELVGDSELANKWARSGIPLVGERVGLGQLVPSLKGVREMIQGDTAQGLKDTLGPSANFIGNVFKGIGNGDPIALSPSFVKKAINGFNASKNDYTTDDKGNKILTNVNDFEGMLMMLGFDSSSVSNQKDMNNMLMTYRKNLIDIKNSYVNKVKEARNDQDYEKASEILAEARELGYNINYNEIIKNQVKDKDQQTKTINSLSLKDRVKLKQDIKL